MSNDSGETDCFWCGAVYIEKDSTACPSCATKTGSIEVISDKTDL
jgi:hypothetical protein